MSATDISLFVLVIAVAYCAYRLAEIASAVEDIQHRLGRIESVTDREHKDTSVHP